ncbi:MAG TPA: UvrD-helicase domain-containing protein [Vicinamibacterales bacterium]|nr:UvrD-helicase domain-containing protein [Vicinamibacterales bacterium]
MSNSPLADQDARDAIANALDDTLVVEAAAGTGKTTELVKRILRILSTGGADGTVTVGNIVAVTFTEKAAGELKLRLREALEKERTRARENSTSDEIGQRLDRALGELEEAHVSTIHGFCAELLRERPVEARVDPLFTVLTESQAERLFDEAFGAWIQAELADPPEGVRRALRRSVWAGFGRGAAREDGPIDRLRRAAWELAQWRDFTAPWTRLPFDRERAIERLIEELHAFASLAEGPSYARDNLFMDTAPARHLSQEIALQQSFDHVDFDGWEARLADLARDRNFSRARHGRGPGYRPGVPRASVVEAVEQLRAHLDQFRMDADADLAAALQQELRAAVARYEELKTRAGALDFLDLLLKARDLVKQDTGVRRGFQDRFKHIFVDEFQDTDPLQAEILLLLAADDPSSTDWRTSIPTPGRLFIVGDPKQSIYRFRRADVGVYRDVCARLAQCGAKVVQLTTSFRSVPGIQAAVNVAFAPIMTVDAFTLQADYVPLSPFREAPKNQPSVVALPVPSPYGSRNVSAVAIEASLPDATGAFIDWLVNESKWKVTEHAGDEPVPIAARHVCILFRRFLSFGDDVTMPYVQALEARGVKHVLVGGKTFHDREEVEAIRAALAAIEWPDDELSVFASLRGPFFAIGDEELLDWKRTYRVFHPFRIPRSPHPDHLAPIVQALTLLQRWHRRRNYIPVADTIQRLLNATRAHVGLVLRPAGEQALANVLHVAELARQYEAGGGISFRGFVEELRFAADTAQAAEAPILEEGSDGVRMMTVHKAKGLEFPVVILADLTCKLSRAEAGRWIDPPSNLCALKIGGWAPRDLLLHDAEESARDRAESERLAYVAATRARDLLVVPAIGDGPYEGGWLDPLTPAIYPPETMRRSAGKAAGCPPFRSKDSVLIRPDGDPARPGTVAPGAYEISAPSIEHVAGRTSHVARRTSHVTWWDPSLFHLNVSSTFGLRRDDLIVKDGDMFAVEDRLAAYEKWRADREQLLEQGSVPALRVQTATAWAAEAAREGIDEAIAASAEIDVIEIAGAAGRPRGPRFGTLVHAILAIVPLDADAEAIRRTAEVQGQILAASADEIVASAAVVASVLQHDIMSRARRTSRLRRETPVTWTQKDGMLIEGVLDLAFDEDDRTIVVDFKTDHELSAGEARYRAQLQKYVDAVRTATARPASGVLFKV